MLHFTFSFVLKLLGSRHRETKRKQSLWCAVVQLGGSLGETDSPWLRYQGQNALLSCFCVLEVTLQWEKRFDARAVLDIALRNYC